MQGCLLDCLAHASASTRKDVTTDFQTFRAQLANFLQTNKRKPPTAAKPRRAPYVADDDDDDDGGDETVDRELQQPSQCHPEEFLPMKLLNVNNVAVQRLSGKGAHVESASSSSSQASTPLTSKRPKVRFFSRHIPKLFVKGNQVCLIRLLST